MIRTKEELRKVAVLLESLDSNLSDAQAARALNTKDTDVYGDVDNQDVLRELPAMSNPNFGGAFVWDVVTNAATYTGQNPLLLAAADVAKRLLFTFETRLPINMGGKAFEELSSAAIQTGFFTQEQLLILKNLGKTLKSKAEIAGLGSISPDDVAKARKL